jgi:hypothetical protein
MVSQRLLPKKDGKGRVAAVEVMLNSPLISDLIFKGEVHEIKEIMKGVYKIFGNDSDEVRPPPPASVPHARVRRTDPLPQARALRQVHVLGLAPSRRR